MSFESQIPTPSSVATRFASRLAVFYATTFAVTGTYLPFFTVWLKAVGIEASWIGVIVAAPAVTRFTLLPFITMAAERRNAIRAAMITTALITALGFTLLGILRGPLLIFVVFVLTACAWTPIVPLTDGYALKAVARYGLNYGPLRLWGSAAFIAGALMGGVLADLVAAEHLIWLIAAAAWLGAVAGFGLRPLDAPAKPSTQPRGAALLRNPTFLAIIIAAALIQGSHAAYYTFASIVWQQAGFAGATIAVLWVLGVLAEIVVFALSPRFTWSPMWLMLGGALSAVLRWLITAQDPSLALLTVVQLLHGLTFGLTQVGTMGLLVRHVPGHVIARGQGYYTAAAGLAMSTASIASGAVFARYGVAVYDMMAAMGFAGAVVLLLMRRRLLAPTGADQPHSAGSGG
ncbi:PPP family 3-phenylpropionic acid transporter [Rhodopseudomonas thermotolerans]|uniref:PPP family 3-phenylpropionic acid transporter n=2 Tax=Rhodopseudomonas TaxID=1073 RepID=A0A336JNX5_9BRAD|nr:MULTISPECIES: MFS transporter [Rhodopseudomonas]RED38081.1 PPP family 3-phenylpropionic acid transporter [Rhodopseudomonas pentothenatexigens]REG05274.1 PPP family 3-phenylpropionic acid transporter [Rhodopseudomonas thermotolerans]SSW90106.1 PPP family 3-phenylpropionic acid transporter [Rhodopseudomonas pentothenatexigens]